MAIARRLAAAVVLGAAASALLPATPAAAHPLGNFTLNQHAGLVVSRNGVAVDFVVDMAEIPAFQTRRQIDRDHDDRIDSPEAAAYRGNACREAQHGLRVAIDDRVAIISVRSSELAFPPGQAGLPTLRLSCRFEAPADIAPTGARVTFRNDNFTGRVGWREVTAIANGVAISERDVPAESASRQLREYPEDLLASPLDELHATLVVAPGTVPFAIPVGAIDVGGAGGSEVASPLLRGTDRFTAAFTGLVARQDFTPWFGFTALLAAVLLGALHALAPGHGKTVMAAYLIGERGSLRQAGLLGLTVTATHTAGVLILGLLLSGSALFVPERLYPWLGAASGALLAGVGGVLFRRAWRRRHAGDLFPGGLHHDHDHDHDHDHAHGHHHRGADHHQNDRPAVSRRALMAMGVAGGLVPSPSALVVLLGAIALGRTWFGVLLVLGYGAGMALTLIAAGLVLVRARSSLDRGVAGRSGGRVATLSRALPIATASLVVVAGVGLTARAVTQI